MRADRGKSGVRSGWILVQADRRTASASRVVQRFKLMKKPNQPEHRCFGDDGNAGFLATLALLALRRPGPEHSQRTAPLNMPVSRYAALARASEPNEVWTLCANKWPRERQTYIVYPVIEGQERPAGARFSPRRGASGRGFCHIHGSQEKRQNRRSFSGIGARSRSKCEVGREVGAQIRCRNV